MRSTFIRLLYERAKESALLSAIGSNGSGCYLLDPKQFLEIPTSPFAYWIGDGIRRAFLELDPFESNGRVARQGLATSDDFRFVRCWFELTKTTDWLPTAKGGRFGRFYCDLQAVSNWQLSGAEMKAFAETRPGVEHWSKRITNTNWYCQPGITWPLRGLRFSAQAVPAGAIFTIAGKMAFGPRGELLAVLGVINSAAFNGLMKLFAGKEGGVQYESGLIQRTPVPDFSGANSVALSSLAHAGWSARRSLDTVIEVSHAFAVPALLQVAGSSLDERVAGWAKHVALTEAELERMQVKLDDLCFELYGFSQEDRRAISEETSVFDDVDNVDEDVNSVGTDDIDVDGEEVIELDSYALAAGLASWAVGVAAGRFDLRLAMGQRVMAKEPDPFDALPRCSPGMLADGNGSPMAPMPAEYEVNVSPVLVGDPGHRLDITDRVRSVFDAMFGEYADEWWRDVGVALGARGGEIESWLNRGFFDYHLKTYSRSRRKAPILWPIGTRSGSYIVWLYAHRVSSDSLFQLLNDILIPKVQVADRELARLSKEAGTDSTAAQRKAIDAQRKFVSELGEFRERLEEAAPLWAPDLRDGIVIVLAPFWMLFAHHRAWSAELRRRWARLCKGEYDWAQLAMRLWPERVVPKCASDRSLAIAHGLSDLLWVKDPQNDEKWLPRQIPATLIDELVGQRHNPAIAAALQRVGT